MMSSPSPKNTSPAGVQRSKAVFLVLGGITVIFVALTLLWYYHLVTKPMIHLVHQRSCYFYIRTGSGFGAVKDSLVKKGYLTDPEKFEWLARRKHYDQHVKPGRYRLVNGMRNNVLVNLLRSGKQEPVRIIIQNVRTRNELAGKIGGHLEVDSVHLVKMFNDPAYLAAFHLSPATLFVLFIPDTYEFYWNTSGDQLFKRMDLEYKRFWNIGRTRLADSLKLSVIEVVTLASIVEKESNKNEEKPVIAGVYLNRLKKQIPLQADPTVIFAWDDYRIRRVLKVHTEINSPYNTYNRTGLPPGPICLPSIASIDAVLHAKKHAYYYFCAREDLSGYHNFAANLEEHNRNARKYQKSLDKMNIR
jgi:UPF0755 protein